MSSLSTFVWLLTNKVKESISVRKVIAPFSSMISILIGKLFFKSFLFRKLLLLSSSFCKQDKIDAKGLQNILPGNKVTSSENLNLFVS